MTESFNRKLGRLAQNVSGTGTITSNAATATAWQTARTITLGGDLSGNVNIDGTENVTLTATVSGDAVVLGTDTTGDYVAAVAVSGAGLSVSGSGEAATYTITSNATSANTASTIVARDASNNFSAGTITSALTGNATTATTLQTARTINGVSFDGSANITVASAAGTLTGTTLASGVTTSSLTSVGTLSSLTVSGTITGASVSTPSVISVGATPILIQPNGVTRMTIGTDGDPVVVTVALQATKFVPTSTTATGNGMYLPATNTLGFSTNGVQRMSIDASGNVGIGTTSPSSVLTVKAGASDGVGVRILRNASNNALLQITDDPVTVANVAISWTNSTTSANLLSSGILTFTASGAERMRIDASGNVGIGVTNPETSRLLVRGSTSDSTSNIFQASNAAGATRFIVRADGQTIFYGSDNGEKVRITETGSVGIGTTSPGETLNVVGGGSTTSTLNVTGGNNNDNATIASDYNLVFQVDANNNIGGRTYDWRYGGKGYSDGTLLMRLDASGNVGIGASPTGYGSAYKELRLNADIIPIMDWAIGGTRTLSIFATASLPVIKTVTNVPLAFATNDEERARITAGGYFKASNTGTYDNATGAYHERIQSAADWISYDINTNATNPYGIFISYTGASPNGTGNDFLYCRDSGPTIRATIRSNGGLANYSANNVNLASDERLKKDISPLASTWNKLKAMEVVNFRYKDCNEGDPALYGVIAQQVQPIVPELVVVTREAKEAQDATEAQDAVLDEDGNVLTPAIEAKPAVEAAPEYYGIREQPMYWLAIKALQEAMARIEALETSNAELMARIDAIES